MFQPKNVSISNDHMMWLGLHFIRINRRIFKLDRKMRTIYFKMIFFKIAFRNIRIVEFGVHLCTSYMFVCHEPQMTKIIWKKVFFPLQVEFGSNSHDESYGYNIHKCLHTTNKFSFHRNYILLILHTFSFKKKRKQKNVSQQEFTYV